MILALLVISVLAYGLQNVLMAGLFRRHDLLVLVAMRGLTLGLVMAPLLLLAEASDWRALGQHLPSLALACAAAMAANLSQATAVRHLAIGVAYALCMVLSTLLTVIYSIVVLAERPGLLELLCGGLVLSASVGLALSGRGNGPAAGRPGRGLLAAACFGVCMATALAALTALTRGTSPFLAAWAWETGIGVMMLGVCLLRPVWRRLPEWQQWRLWRRTALAAAPTLAGTGCYAMAIDQGRLSLAAAVLSTVMVASAICARLIFKELLSWRQWSLIGVCCAAIIALQLVRQETP